MAGFRNCVGSGPVYEARKAMNLSVPQFESLTGIDKRVIRRVEIEGKSFQKVDLIRRFNAVAPLEFRIRDRYVQRPDEVHQKVQSRICEVCNKVFDYSVSKAKHPTGPKSGKYCSFECYNETRKKRVSFICACGCGETGETTPWYRKRSKNLFIDQSHRNTWYHRQGLSTLKRSSQLLGAGMAQAVENGTKYCNKCKTRKSIQEFGPEKRRYDGLSPQCRNCRAIAARIQRSKKNERTNTN